MTEAPKSSVLQVDAVEQGAAQAFGPGGGKEQADEDRVHDEVGEGAAEHRGPKSGSVSRDAGGATRWTTKRPALTETSIWARLKIDLTRARRRTSWHTPEARRKARSSPERGNTSARQDEEAFVEMVRLRRGPPST